MGKVLEMNKTLIGFDEVKVGSIFYSSWGYDQTNIDWYEVVGLTGKGVKVRLIESNKEYDGSMIGSCMPRVGMYVGDSKTKQLRWMGKEIYFRVNSFSCAWLWDGNAKRFSEYA